MESLYLKQRRLEKLGLKEPEEKPKPKGIAQMSHKRKVDLEDKKIGDAWFIARHRQMKGKCLICGEPTTKGTDIFKNSIAHLFPKAYFTTIKWHEDNWFEACFFGNSCHTNFDNKILTFEDLKHTKAWPEFVRKFKILYPLMNSEEQGRIPQILKDELEIDVALATYDEQLKAVIIE